MLADDAVGCSPRARSAVQREEKTSQRGKKQSGE